MHAQHRSLARGAGLGAVFGAIIGVVVTVAVYESTLRRQHHSEAVALQATSAPVSASSSTALQVAERRLATVLSTVKATEAAVAGDTHALVNENARLRALVDKRDEELALLDVERKEREGEALPFPKDLPARFTDKELLSTLTTALKEAGLKGDVIAIDCAEYPCIVWGEASLGNDRDLVTELGRSPAFAAYNDDSKRVSLWGSSASENEDNRLFALTLSPKTAMKEDESHRFSKRLRDRADAGFEANKPASWAASDK